MHLRKRQHVFSYSAIILRASCSLSGKICFSKKQMKTDYALLHLCARAVQGSFGAAFTALFHSLCFLAIPTLAALFRWVCSPYWRSPLQRSRSMMFGRWRSTALFNPPIFSLAVLQTGDVGSFLFHSRL